MIVIVIVSARPDQETLQLFAVPKLCPDHRMETLSTRPVMQRWWQQMAELIETGPDSRPRIWPLESTFHVA